MNLVSLAALGTILIAVLTVWVFARPSLKRNNAVADAILGEEEIRDRSGSLIRAGRPGLIHVQAAVDQRLSNIEGVVAKLADQDVRLGHLESTTVVHGADIAALKDAREERMGIRRETEAMLRAVAEKDTINGEAVD